MPTKQEVIGAGRGTVGKTAGAAGKSIATTD
jgi:hypothetical protein